MHEPTPRGEETWRADALAQSRHTRWTDELRAPLADHDPDKAAAICAAVTRAALRDFAPALLLLSAAERTRARALAAYVLTLFDFAGQAGLEGERLAQINRLEFDLEAALGGEPSGQPVFVLMACTGPWPRQALDEIAAAARSRAVQPRPASERAVSEQALQLGGALVDALAGTRSDGTSALAAGLLRLGDLLGLSEGARRHRPRLSRQAIPDDWIRGAQANPALDEAIQGECRAIAGLFAAADSSGLSPTWRRAARYLRAAGRRLLRASEHLGEGLLGGPPEIGPITRTALLLRSFVP